MDSDDKKTGRTPLAVSVIVGVVGTVALLLLGAAAGLLIKAPSDQSAASEPSPVDIGFAQDMSVHHEQAVTMATLARERGHDPAVRQLAFDMETNQRGQIGRMHGWLSLWGEPAQSTKQPMHWMHDAGHGSHGGHGRGGAQPSHAASSGSPMPGMASNEELAHLRSLRGKEFDTRFLQLMLRHHEGGVGMATYGKEHAALDPVRQLAGNMLGSQGKESTLMRQMLAERDAEPLPSPR